MRRRRMLGKTVETEAAPKASTGVEVRQVKTADPSRAIEFEARCKVDAPPANTAWTSCGVISIHRTYRGWTETTGVDPGEYWTVGAIEVDDKFQRRGIGTKLYEAAARAACENGGHLASTYRVRGAYSHDFWNKQYAKGRAVKLPYPAYPDDPNRTIYYLPTCPVKTLARPPKRRRRH